MDHGKFSLVNKQVAGIVAELLYVHDCIVLPGFGGLIGNYASARVHPVSHVFQMPSKQLAFNRNLKTDDGLLVNQFAKIENISFTEARKTLVDYSETLNDRLLAGERVDWEHVGQFHSDIERNFQFRAFTTHNFLPESYGLYTLQVSPINRVPSPDRRPEPVFVNREIVSPVKQSRKFPIRAALKTVPFILFAAFIGFNAILPEGKGISKSDFSIFSNTTSAPTFGISAVHSSSLPAVRKAVEVIAVESFSAESAKIFIVAGCYSTEQNASGAVDYLNEKGFNSFVLDQTPAGLYRVVYGSYASVNEASNELSAIKKGLNEEAWLLIR
jgi:hypothetical protein